MCAAANPETRNSRAPDELVDDLARLGPIAEFVDYCAEVRPEPAGLRRRIYRLTLGSDRELGFKRCLRADRTKACAPSESRDYNFASANRAVIPRRATLSRPNGV